MKNDTTTTFLNFILAALVIFSVFLTILNMRDSRLLPQMNAKANFVARVQSLAQDTANFNAQYKSPDLTKILQSVTVKPAAH
jgi:hypothetical protein